MKHFAREEWVVFINNKVGQTEREEMVNHLIICDNCLETYLQKIEEEDDSVSSSSNSLPVVIGTDFADRVMKQIMAENQVLKKKKEAVKKHNLILYYSAAACITLFFVGSGLFNLLISSIPQAATQILDTTRQTEKIVASGWTERLLPTEMDFKLELNILNWGVNDGEQE